MMVKTGLALLAYIAWAGISIYVAINRNTYLALGLATVSCLLFFFLLRRLELSDVGVTEKARLREGERHLTDADYKRLGPNGNAQLAKLFAELAEASGTHILAHENVRIDGEMGPQLKETTYSLRRLT